MAKILTGGGVAEIRGSIAGTTFSRNRGGAYTRNRVSPVQPQTPAQLAQRERFTVLSKAWGADLTQAERDGWDAFSQLFPVTDIFGLQTILTGQQMYVRLNTRLLAGGQPRIDTAPIDQNVPAFDSINMTVTAGPSDLDINFSSASATVNDHIQIFAAPPQPPGRSFIKNIVRLTLTSTGGPTTPLDFTADYVLLFGDPVAGQKVSALVNWLRATNGAVTSPVRLDVLVA